MLFFHNNTKDTAEHFFITGKRICVFAIGNTNSLIISVSPQVKTFIVNMLPSN